MSGKRTDEAKGRGDSAPAIAIFVFGRREYAYAAQHLALTLKEHSPEIPVHIWADEDLPVHPSYYTEVHRLDPIWYQDGPGALKLHIHDILPAGDWLYLDADMLCLSDIGPAIESLKAHDFALDVRGSGGENDSIPYTPWATNETVRRVAKLPADAVYYGVQTSWMWIRKGAPAPMLVFGAARDLHDKFKPSDLKEQWGGSIPDELCISAALSKTGIEPHSAPITFYGTHGAYGNKFNEAKRNHPLACLYGDTRMHRLVATRWIDQYDRYVRAMYQRKGRLIGMDIHRIMKNKHVTK